MGRSAEDGGAEDINKQIRMDFEWVAGCKEGDQPSRLVPPGREEGRRQEALARARKIMKDAKKKGPEMEEEPEGGRQGRWRGLRREREGQMQFVVEDGDEGGAQQGGGWEPRPEGDSQVGQVGQGNGETVGEGERAALDGGQRSGWGWLSVRRDGIAGERPETTAQGILASDNGRRKRCRRNCWERRGWSKRRTVGGQRGRERGGYSTMRRGAKNQEEWGKA